MGFEFSRKGAKTKLYVGAVPRRKREAICVEEATTLWPVAYFPDDESRDRFLASLRDLTEGLLPGRVIGRLQTSDPEIDGALVIRSPHDDEETT